MCSDVIHAFLDNPDAQRLYIYRDGDVVAATNTLSKIDVKCSVLFFVKPPIVLTQELSMYVIRCHDNSNEARLQ